MRFRGAATIAFVGRRQSLFFYTTCDEGAANARSVGYSVLLQVHYDDTGPSSRIDDLAPGSDDARYHEALAANVSALSPDVVVGCMASDEADVYTRAWRAAGWAPRAAFFTCSTWGWPEAMGLDGGVRRVSAALASAASRAAPLTRCSSRLGVAAGRRLPHRRRAVVLLDGLHG